MGGCRTCDDEFGAEVGVPELRARAKKKYDSPDSAFEDFDESGSGSLSRGEFVDQAKNLNPPIQNEELQIYLTSSMKMRME